MLLFDEHENATDSKRKLESQGKDAAGKNESESFSPQNSKESVARFINAMASIKTGRDYISELYKTLPHSV